MARVEVHKFGGTSVGSAARMREVAAILEGVVRSEGSPQIVAVSSAMTKVTDQLVEAAARAARGDTAVATGIIEGIRARHQEALAILGGDPEAHAAIRARCDEADALVRASTWLGEITPRARDRLLATGEKLAVILVSLALRERGLRAVPVEADTFLETDARFGEANPLGEIADRTTERALRPLLADGVIPVVTGFIGRAPDGATTILGRGGSDYTATLLAAALRADAVTIWTDVDGVFTADPRNVPGARVIPQLHYREAAEMSYYGAKVLHQRTMIPVASLGIPVWTRNTMNPAAEGTVVDGRFTPGSHPVKAITAVAGQALLSVEGKGMAGVPGVAARVFTALAAKEISVTMISQSSSESSITFAVPSAEVRAAESALKDAFRDALSKGDIEEITARGGVSLVAAVGLGMARTPGVAARVFAALAAARVNVLAIAQGSSELNISLAVDASQQALAIRAVHEAFGLDRRDPGVEGGRTLDVILLGSGKIGREVAKLLEAQSDVFASRAGLRPRVVAVADRAGYVLAPAGLPWERLRGLLAAKADGKPLPGATPTTDPAAVVQDALGWRLSRPLLIDCSDARTGAAWSAALRGGADVVTANKVPLAEAYADFAAFQEDSARSGARLRAEATVGAGLPVIDTLDTLLTTGDALKSASGALSGTLGFVMTALGDGVDLSVAVKDAHARGYTEPDPVIDLCGKDVARKAVILARMAGLVDGDVEVARTPLAPDEWLGLPLDALWERLAGLDAAWRERVAAAAARGEVLRYVAAVSAGKVEVGPVAVPKDSPLGALRGTDNLIVFHSARYAERPLVISGPGAGVAVTAMGVLGDVFRTASARSTRT